MTSDQSEPQDSDSGLLEPLPVPPELADSMPELADSMEELYAGWLDEVLGALDLHRDRGSGSETGEGEDDDSDSMPQLIDDLRKRPDRVERYRTLESIGRGGMGTIERVWDRELHRDLAMKLTRKRLRGSWAEATESERRGLIRFIEEARVTGQLDHPGIVPVHELGLKENGQVFFTMRLVKGKSFSEVIDLVERGDEEWSLHRALSVLLRVCEAMAFAHSKGVIHRDLKPANIMVGPFGEVYVMDWGLGKFLAQPVLEQPEGAEIDADDDTAAERALKQLVESGSSVAVTLDGTIIGTPTYMAPEQARAQVEDVDRRSDVYSVGSVLYHLLTGRPPYVSEGTEETPLHVWQRLMAGPPMPAGELQPSAPVELVSICEKAMQRDPKARYASMEALARDLRSFMEGRVVSAFEVGPAAEARKWVVRNRGVAIWAAAAVLAIIAGLAGVAFVETRARRTAEHQRGLAEQSEERAGELATLAEQ